MKKKIIASLLAACLFVGMAVPAFADYYSSVAGDPTKIETIDFANDKGEKITSLTIEQNKSEDIAKYVRLFENKDTLILDKSYVSYALKDNTINFGINGSNVTAINATGETTVVVTSTLDNKKIGEIKVKASPAVAPKLATGYRFKDTSYVGTAGAVSADAAEAKDIDIVAIPAGSEFSIGQRSEISNNLKADLESALSSHSPAGNTVLVNAAEVLAVTGMPIGTTIKFATANQAGTTNTVTAAWTSLTEMTVTMTVKSSATAGIGDRISVAAIQDAIRKATKVGFTTAPTASTALVFAKNAAGNIGDVQVALSALTPATVVTSPILAVTAPDATTVRFALTAPDADVAYPVQKLAVKDSSLFSDGNTATQRTVTTTTMLQLDNAKAATKIGGPGSITIEVGEVYNFDGKIVYAPTAANTNRGFTLNLDYVDSSVAVANDFAALEDVAGATKIIGVKTGVNKIVASLNGTNETATTIVNVVAKGTKKPAATAELTSTVHPKMVVGGTALQIKVKNAPVDAVIGYKVLAGSESYVKVDDKGAITAIKATPAGMIAKVYVTFDGKDSGLYTNITVTDLPTTTPGTDKPTTPPATGV